MPVYEKKALFVETAHYFAYGLDMDPARFSQRGIPFESAAPAVLLGYRLVFNALEDRYFRFERRGIANINPSAGDSVEGMVYRIRMEDLSELDECIGVRDFKYYRKQVNVRQESGAYLTALTYAAWPDMTSEGLLPSEAYLRRLIDASGHAISEPFRQWLMQHPTTM